jgi:CRISPR-associated protein Csb2
LFQAITAGALSGRWAIEDRQASESALRWLEQLGLPKIILAPQAEGLSPYRIAVPNNQADRHLAALKKGAYLDRLLARDKELKVVWPRTVRRAALIYAWEIAETSRDEAEATRAVVRRLVVLGTGLDHAVADIRIAPSPPAATNGVIAWRSAASPCKGTLDSLIGLHKAKLERLKSGSLGENLPPIRYRPAQPLARNNAHLVFALRTPVNDAPRPTEPEATAVLAHAIRLSLADRLMKPLRECPERAPGTSPEEIERLVIGRGASASDTARRLCVLPLPSIGHEHADGLLRRVLVSVPAGFPLRPESIRRALNNCEIHVELSPSRALDVRLALVDDDDVRERRMLARFLGRARVWRSVSPILLPGRVARRRVSDRATDEAQLRREEKRRRDEGILFERALKHAGVGTITGFRLRREPFGPHQPRADANWRLPTSSNDSRRVWLSGRPRLHVEITFPTPVSGPLVIGDGRWLGLGLMAPVREEPPAVHLFSIDPREAPVIAEREAVTQALRNAVMARVDEEWRGSRRGRRNEPLPLFFTGHELDGKPACSGHHEHLFFLADDIDGDGRIDRLAVVAPHLADRTVTYSPERRSDMQDHLHVLERALIDFTLLRAGRVGAPHLAHISEPDDNDPLFGRARIWVSHTSYRPTRHPKGRDINQAVTDDLVNECARRGLPRPRVEIIQSKLGRRGGLAIRARLHFKIAISGPLVLGRGSHFGAGLFLREDMNKNISRVASG